MTKAGLSACICDDSNQLGLVIASACKTHVEAFWSKSDQNGVTSAKRTSTRSTERTPAIALSGCLPRIASSCIQTPTPPKPITATNARHAAITNPNFGMSTKDPTAAAAPRIARTRPRIPAAKAVRQTLRNESGSGGVGGSMTYCFRAIQSTKVETNMSTPGIPNAIAGPSFRRKIGINPDANNEPKLMIQ